MSSETEESKKRCVRVPSKGYYFLNSFLFLVVLSDHRCQGKIPPPEALHIVMLA